jgi:hypothetical protein
LRIGRLSAERFIICTSLAIIRCATPRPPSAARQAQFGDDHRVLGTGDLDVV